MVKCLDELDATFQALADPTRRSILQELAAGERCVSDLARPHAMSLPAISKHLKVLEKAGLVIRRRAGREHLIKANPEPVHHARDWMNRHAEHWERHFDALEAYLARAGRKSTGSGSKGNT